VAGGMESMSQAPFYLMDARKGWKPGDHKAVDGIIHDGLKCAFEHWHMGEAAEHIAAKCGISRAEQDRYAVQSQQRAASAWRRNLFADETLALALDGGSKALSLSPLMLSRDECMRPATNCEGLAKLQPAFRPDGTVTAGNASTLSDGAAALVVGSARMAETLNVKPLARIVAYATSGVAPKDVFLAPVPAIRQVLEKARLTLRDIDLFEINEAFAAQAVACNRELGLDEERVNVHGGAIALGHPIGASGARVLVTLVSALESRAEKRGVAALCLGGGNAVAMVIER
jgi:acetyl-CoA C-acetyltransferase